MWIKVNKRRKTVYQNTGINPDNEKTFTCFFVEVESVPEIYGAGDFIKFELDTPLTDEEIGTENLIKQSTDGSFIHALTESEVAENEKAARNEAKRKQRGIILSELWGAATAEQQGELVAVLTPAFIVALDNYNYDLARQLLAGKLSAGEISQELHDLVENQIPVYEE